MLEFSSEHQVTIFYCESDQGGGVSCLGDLQRSSGHSLSRVVGPDDLQRLLPTSAIISFYDRHRKILKT